MSPLTGKESTTKAGWFWQAIHTEREFSAAYLNAILADDSKAIASALDLIGKFPEDVELTQDELLAFSKGVTASGELEITSWEGYYITDPLPDGRVFALLISSFDNRVFWGPEKEFADKYWSKHEVDYQLGPNATLCFASDNDVTLSFSRVCDVEEAKFSNVRMKGTMGSTAISGAPKAPPLPVSEAQNSAGGTVILDAQQALLLSGSARPFSADPEDDQPFILSDGWKTYTAYAGIYKEPAVLIGVIIWLCPPLRKKCFKYLWELRRLVGSGIENCLQWKQKHLSGTHVDLALAIETINQEITQKLNEELRNADFDTKPLEQIMRERKLYDIASTQMGESLKTYIQEHLKVIANQDVADMPSDLAKRMELEVPNWVKKEVDERSALVMENFDSLSHGIDAIVRTVAMEAHKQYYHDNVETLVHKLEEIDSFVKTTKDNIVTQREQIVWWKNKAEELRKAGEKVQADLAEHEATTLEKQIEDERRDIEKKEQEREPTQTEKEAEEEKGRKYTPEEIEERRQVWEREAKEHIKA